LARIGWALGYAFSHVFQREAVRWRAGGFSAAMLLATVLLHYVSQLDRLRVYRESFLVCDYPSYFDGLNYTGFVRLSGYVGNVLVLIFQR